MRTAVKLLVFSIAASLFVNRAGAMTVDVKLMSRSFRLGEPVYCWIQFTNDSSETVFMLKVNEGNTHGLEVRGSDGVALKYRGPWADFPPGEHFRKFAPGEVRVVRFDLQGSFDLTTPGTYTLSYQFPAERIDRVLARFPSEAPADRVVRAPKVATPTSFAVTDPSDPVTQLLKDWKARKRQSGYGGAIVELADVILEQHPQSAYAPAAKMMLVWRYFGGPESTRFSRAQQVEKASETLTELCRDRRNGYLCAPAAAYLIEKAISRDQPSIANSWIDFLKREFPNQPPAALARIKEREIGEGVKGGNGQ